MFELANDAVHVGSQRAGVFYSLRQAVVAGLDLLVNASRVDRLIMVKSFNRGELAGDRVFILSFNADERRLLNETRNLITSQSQTGLTIEDTIMLALIALAREK